MYYIYHTCILHNHSSALFDIEIVWVSVPKHTSSSFATPDPETFEFFRWHRYRLFTLTAPESEDIIHVIQFMCISSSWYMYKYIILSSLVWMTGLVVTDKSDGWKSTFQLLFQLNTNIDSGYLFIIIIYRLKHNHSNNELTTMRYIKTGWSHNIISLNSK